jgi:hypothetical protein
MEHEDHPTEDPRYVEVVEEYDRLSRKESFAKGRVLIQIRDEKLFGRWGTLTNCMIGRLKFSERQGFT